MVHLATCLFLAKSLIYPPAAYRCFFFIAQALLSGTSLWDVLAVLQVLLPQMPVFLEKYIFRVLIMPMASIVSSLIKFGIQISLFLVFYFYFILFRDYHPNVGVGFIIYPLSLIVLAGIGFGFGIMVSSVTTKYRDLGIMVGFAMSVVMYLTPVIYSYPTLSPRLKYWVSFNPLVAPIEMFRYAWFGIGEFSIGSFMYSVVWMIILLLVGIVLFNKVEKNFMDTV